MTSNQIEYVKHQETLRHDLAMEQETQRADLAKEREQARANDLNYAASTYSAQASMYNARLNYDANIYASQLNAAVRQQEIETNARIQGQKNLDTLMLENSAQRETHRHNVAMEQAQAQTADAKTMSGFGSVLNALGSFASMARIFMVA